MLFSSPVYSAASGSIAGITYSHGRSGLVCKSRSTPTNPDTPRQRTVKYALARLSPYWGQELTQVQRDAWDLYGANVEMRNALGKTIFLTGSNHFLRANIPRIQSSLSVMETAPTVFNLGFFTYPIHLGAVEVGDQVGIEIDNTDAWANTPGAHMLVYVGRPTGPGHLFFGGPYRFGARIDGDSPPPVDVQVFTAPWFLSTGNLLWIYVRVIQLDGRLSAVRNLGGELIRAF